MWATGNSTLWTRPGAGTGTVLHLAMRGRTAVSTVIALVAIATLTSCSVPGTGVIGLIKRDGLISAVVRTCDDVTANEVHMIPADGQFFLIPHPSWSFDESNDVTAQLGTVAEFITLVGETEQGLQSTVSDGVGGYMRFRASDIENLDEGKILAGAYDGSAVVVDSRGLEVLLAEECKNF